MKKLIIALLVVGGFVLSFCVGHFVANYNHKVEMERQWELGDTIRLKGNSVGWFEIAVDSMSRAVKFYETVLDIKMIDRGTPESMMFFAENRGQYGSAGALCYSPADFRPSTEGGTMVFLNSSSDDISFELLRVEVAGGKILVQKTCVGIDRGYFAVILDTEGNKVGLYSKY